MMTSQDLGNRLSLLQPRFGYCGFYEKKKDGCPEVHIHVFKVCSGFAGHFRNVLSPDKSTPRNYNSRATYAITEIHLPCLADEKFISQRVDVMQTSNGTNFLWKVTNHLTHKRDPYIDCPCLTNSRFRCCTASSRPATPAAE